MHEDLKRKLELMLKAGAADEAVEVETGVSLSDIVMLRALAASAPPQTHFGRCEPLVGP